MLLVVLCVACWPATAFTSGSDFYVPVATLTATKAPSAGSIPPSKEPWGTLGTSVAVSANGRVLAVGAPTVSRLYVYLRPGDGQWKDAHQTATLLGYTNTDGLGSSVAVSADGSTIVAGAPDENGGAGAVYVYVEPQGGWGDATTSPTMMLRAADGTGNDSLGASVAVSADGSTIVAGAPGWNDEQGAIYLFTRAARGWRHNKPLTGRWANVGESGGNSAYGGAFGQSVAMSQDGDTIAVGAPNESGWEGGVYVFARAHGGALRGRVELRDLASGTSDTFFDCSPSSGSGIDNPELGTTLAVSSDGRTIAAGEPCSGTGGEAAVYTEPAGGWLHASSRITAGLTPLAPNAMYTREFGYFVALSGDGQTLIASDPYFSNGYGSFVGWFHEPQRGWSHVNPPVATNFGVVSGSSALAHGSADITAGDPIAIGSIGGTIFVGGVGGQNEGAVYVFNETTVGPTPTELTCSPTKVAVGSPSDCSMTVSESSPTGITPTGSVSFSAGGGSLGGFSSDHCLLKTLGGKVRAGRCDVTFTPTSAGADTIVASYSGDVHHLAAVGVAIVRTSVLATTTSVMCAPTTVGAGAKSECTATTSGLGPQRAVINFKPGGGVIGSERCTSTKTSESCAAPFSAAAAGKYIVVAEYPGDTGHEPSSGHSTVTVRAAPATTTTGTTGGGPASTVVTVIAGEPRVYTFKLSTATQPTVISDTPGAGELTVPMGEVTFNVSNPTSGIVSHSFEVCTSPLPKPITTLTGVQGLPDSCGGDSTAVLAPGDSATLSVDFTTPGAYEYLSTANNPDGDAFSGMKGVLNVS